MCPTLRCRTTVVYCNSHTILSSLKREARGLGGMAMSVRKPDTRLPKMLLYGEVNGRGFCLERCFVV